MRYLPGLTLIVLSICVIVAQTREKPEPAEPRCQYQDGNVRVNIPVSSEKECQRIKTVRSRKERQ